LRNGEVAEYIRSYPVPDETASKNIIAFTLSRFGEQPPPAYGAQLRAYGLSIFKRRHFMRRFKEYHRKRNEPDAVFMAMPLLSYIPNYRNVQN
jgi:hypothetical protein